MLAHSGHGHLTVVACQFAVRLLVHRHWTGSGHLTHKLPPLHHLLAAHTEGGEHRWGELGK